jgi:hypothetical protein
VTAYLDVLGTATFNAAIDPSGSVQTSWLGASVTGLAITLTDPAPQLLTQSPTNVGAYPGESAVFVTWAPLTDGNGANLADHYSVYSNNSANVTGASVQTVAERSFGGAMFSGLDGTQLFFAVAGVNQGVEGPLSAWVGPVTVGAPPGEPVTGTVDLTGIAQPGPLAVTLIQFGADGNPSAYYFDDIAAPAGLQAYTIGGVPPGTYTLCAFLDNGNGFSADGPNSCNLESEILPSVTVLAASSGTSAPTVTIPGGPAIAYVTVLYAASGNAGYQLTFQEFNSLNEIVRLTLASGPGVDTPSDLTTRPNTGGGQFSRTSTSASPPSVGDSYVFDVTYADGTTCNLTSSIAVVPSSPPTPVAPIGSGSGQPLTFSWSAPATPPSGPWSYEMYVEVYQQTSDVDDWNGVSTSTSYQSSYGYSPGTEYQWTIQTVDQYGNQASNWSTFTYQ